MGNCPCKDSNRTSETAEEVQADAEPLQLAIAIAGVRGLRGKAWQPGGDKPDCFCVVKAQGSEEDLCRTEGSKGAFEPAWKEQFEVAEHRAGKSLEFSVWEEDKALGTATLEASAFDSTGFNGELKLDKTEEGIEAYLRVKVGVNGREFPIGAQAEVTITVTKQENKPLALDIDTQDSVTCNVCAIREGPFHIHNENSKVSDQLGVGDFIMKANNAEGNTEKLLKEMKTATTLTVTVRRFEEFVVTVERADKKKPLGLDLAKKPAGYALFVTKDVPKGPFKTWNEANKDREVRKGDRIVAVCGKRGTGAELQKHLGTLKEIEVTILRPASLDSWRFW